MARNRIPLAVCLAAIALAAAARAQDTPAASAPAPPTAEEWMKLGQPGPAHETLAALVGEWTFTMTGQGMDGKTQTSEGTERCEMILGGRYLRCTSKSVIDGMPFEGLGYWGYDNATGEHFNVWFDNMSTGTMLARGKTDPEGRVVVTGPFAEPGGVEVLYRMVASSTGKDTRTLEMFVTRPPEGEQHVMEIKYTRVRP